MEIEISEEEITSGDLSSVQAKIDAAFRDKFQSLINGNAKVLVASSVTVGKEYCLPFFCGVLGTLGGADVLTIDDGAGIKGANLVLPPLEGDFPYYARAARPREAARKQFLDGDWTHLYFQDCDIIPPADIISRLLALDCPVASGIYAMRGLTEPVIPAVLNFEAGPAGLLLTNMGAIDAKEGAAWLVHSFGMGCMLIRRDALEATPFRTPEYLAELKISEDFAWCREAAAGGFGNVQIDLSCSCWHCDSDWTANRLTVGPMRTGATWVGASHFVRNSFGEWVKGQPRFDLTEAQAAELGPGFHVAPCRETALETAKTEDILPR